MTDSTLPSSQARNSLRSRTKRALDRSKNEARFTLWSLTTAEGRNNHARVKALSDRYRGKRAFIMGNGPSLLKSDLNALAADVTIVSNAHFLIWDQLSYVPTFLTVEDRLVAEDRADDLSALDGITRIYPFDLRATLGRAGDRTLYVHFPREYEPWPRFSDDLQRRAYWGGTVSFLNLQLAAYLGCNPIVLLGFDHSYSVPTGEREGLVIHSQGEDINHIHPNYFGPGYRWHDPNVARMEMAYRCARVELDRRGIAVLNATVGGHLEVFERASLEQIL